MGNRIFVVAGLVCLLSTSARATQGNAPPPPAAQKAFAAGKKLYDAGDKKGAVEKFKEAYRVSRNPLLLYNIGLVYDEIGDKMLALHYYALFIDKAKTFPKAAENRKLAGDRIVAIKAEMDAAAKPAPAPAEHVEAPAPADRPRARTVAKFTHETIDS